MPSKAAATTAVAVAAPAVVPLNASLVAPSVLDSRADRDYARQRQRLMKPSDRKKGQNIVRATKCKPSKWSSNDAGAKKSISSAKKDFLDSSDTSSGDDDAEHVYLPPFVVASQDFNPPESVTEVQLEDIAKPAKRRGGLASTFEFIPRPRPVVPLPEWGAERSDASSSDDAALEEWEHIESAAERKAKRKAHRRVVKPATYATVAATNPKA